MGLREEGKVSRRLAAILAADIAGYSRLMGEDEAATVRALKGHQAEVLPLVATYGGRIIDTAGDGILAEFPSVVDAAECAVEIQSVMRRRNETEAKNRRMQFRIGINLGDVIHDDVRIYGDGINIAARLEGIAQPGGICVSSKVREEVLDKLDLQFLDLGEQTLKNIARPVHVFALRAANTKTPSAAMLRKRQRLSICVLPFANMSGDPEQEYFSDGITEDIITDLSKVSALAVVSRNTAFTFKAKHIEVAQVARQLKVSHVLEGSVRKSGNRVRVTAQLVDGATDSHLWAERFDRNLDDIFALQDEIAEAIVKALKLQLLPAEKEAIEQRSTTNPEAYKLYLMARQYNATGNSRHRDITVRLCQRAIEIDPEYARAWALLAISQVNRRLMNAETGDDGWPAAERALALQPDLAEAHAAKGRILGDAGRYDDALVEHATALRLDPDGYEVNAAAARCYIGMRRNEDAVGCLERAAAAIETDFWALGVAIQSYEAMGDIDGAKSAARRCLERVEKAIVAEPDHGLALGFGVSALVALHEVDRAKEWAARAMLLDPDNRNLNYNLACNMVRLGELETAIELLAPIITRAQRQNLLWHESDTSLDPIRGDPRYQALVAQAEARLASTP